VKSFRQLAVEYGLTADQVSVIVRVLGVEPTRFGTALGVTPEQEAELRHAFLLIGRRKRSGRAKRSRARPTASANAG